MAFRKMLLALVACVAFAAFATSSAQAAEGEGWTIEGVKLAAGKTETVTASKNAGSSLQLTAELLNKKLTLDATEVSCVSCTIDNTTKAGHSAGSLKFTGVTVTEPANCTVHSAGQPDGTVVTNALTDEVIMDPTAGSTAVFDKFFPESGSTFVTLEFTGATCVFAELDVTVEGTATGQAVHGSNDEPSKTGENFVTQSLLFNKAAQETGGGLLYLSGVKTKPAFLDATVNNVLSGANVGKKFGSD